MARDRERIFDNVPTSRDGRKACSKRQCANVAHWSTMLITAKRSYGWRNLCDCHFAEALRTEEVSRITIRASQTTDLEVG